MPAVVDPRRSSHPRGAGPLLRLAVRPVPLVVLAASGVAVVFGGWIAAVGGAVVYATTVGAMAVLRTRSLPAAPSFVPPQDLRLSIKSREILASVMRIRKAHRGLYDALAKADPTVRLLLVDSYDRIATLVRGTHVLATQADGLQLHIDAARAKGEDPAKLAEVLAKREAAAAELVRVAEAIEAVTPRVAAETPIEVDDAYQVANDLAGELERMKELLQEVIPG